MRLVFDVESDGLLPVMTKIHCIVAKDIDTGVVYKFGPDRITEAVAMLRSADELIGHGIVQFDTEGIRKLYPSFPKDLNTFDTLIAARLLIPDIKSEDWEKRSKTMPPKLMGKHGLESWGWRVGTLKGEFAKTTDWQVYSEEMLEYCARDVEVTALVYQYIDDLRKRVGWCDDAYRREERFARCIARMQERGVLFDTDAAMKLVGTLQIERARVDSQMVGLVSDFEDEYTTPKKQIKKIRKTVFNPGSRDHIARHLQERRGWKPVEFTEGGKPKIDEDVLIHLEWPEAKLLAHRFLIEKRIGQVADGKEAWLKAVKDDGRIHGFVNHNGAVTQRCTHSGPNTAQVPRCGSLFGKECRSLFKARPGYKIVGCDAKGLELRCLAHYLAKFDDGAYGKVVCFGDPHTENQKAAGLQTRDQAKTFIYALLYGAGDAKLGTIVGGDATAGKRLRQRFMRNTPAYAALKKDLDARVQFRPRLRGIDGRSIVIRSKHAALNTLLQSAGAILMKQATIEACAHFDTMGYDGGMVLHVHDEFQFEVREDQAEALAAYLPKAIARAGEVLGFRVPMTGDSKIGNNWAETH